MGKLKTTIFAGFCILFGLSVTSNAEIMSVSGNITQVTEVRQAVEGGSENNTRIRVFDERQDILVQNGFTVNVPNTGIIDEEDDLFEAIIRTNSPVSSHFFHSDPVGNQLRTYSGCVTFRDEVIGIMLLDAELDGSDDQFGLSSVTYQQDRLRGFGFPSETSSSFDELDVSENRRTVCVTLRTQFEVDQIRVITSEMGIDAVEFINGVPPGFNGGNGNNGDNGDDDGDGADGFPDSDNCGGLDRAKFDIVPGNRDNTIHIDGSGKTPIALFSREDFDAPGCIDATSLTFGRTGDEETLMGCGAWDFNMDGYIDLQCDFMTNDTEFRVGDEIGIMRGQTNSGQDVMFTDKVTVHAAHRGVSICSLNVVRMLNLHNRIYFFGLGTGIQEIRVEVFSIQGQSVYDSGFASGTRVAWNKRLSNGGSLANGVYFYLVTARGDGNQLVRSSIKKFVILR